MHRSAVAILLLAALSPGCRGRGAEAHRAQAASAAPAEYRLVAGPAQRVPYSSYPDVVYPLLIRGPGGARQVPGLFVADSSALAAVFDSLALAPAFNAGGAMIGLVRFHGTSGQLDTLPMPPGLSPNLTSLALSPDGRYLAYIEVDGGQQPYGIVRSVADQAEVTRTPPVTAAAANTQIGFARWLDARHVLLAVDVDARRDRWARFRGAVGGGSLAQDTVAGDALTTAP